MPSACDWQNASAIAARYCFAWSVSLTGWTEAGSRPVYAAACVAGISVSIPNSAYRIGSAAGCALLPKAASRSGAELLVVAEPDGGRVRVRQAGRRRVAVGVGV